MTGTLTAPPAAPTHPGGGPPRRPRLRLLGGFDLTARGRHVDVPPHCERVVAYLALRHRPTQRGHLAGVFWPDLPSQRASANLRAAVWRLGRVGDGRPDSAGGSDAIVEGSRTHVWLSAAVSVDYHEAVARALRLADPRGELAAGDLDEHALDGEFLPRWDGDWVLVERERLRQLRLHALDGLCERLTLAGELAHAIEVALLAVTVEPLRESAQRGLIRAYLAEGNQVEARRQYDRFRDRLRDELGLQPSPLMEALVAGLLPPRRR